MFVATLKIRQVSLLTSHTSTFDPLLLQSPIRLVMKLWCSFRWNTHQLPSSWIGLRLKLILGSHSKSWLCGIFG